MNSWFLCRFKASRGWVGSGSYVDGGGHEQAELTAIYVQRGLEEPLARLSFIMGAALPLLVAWLVTVDNLAWMVGLASLVFLMAMLLTAGVSKLFGTVV